MPTTDLGVVMKELVTTRGAGRGGAGRNLSRSVRFDNHRDFSVSRGRFQRLWRHKDLVLAEIGKAVAMVHEEQLVSSYRRSEDRRRGKQRHAIC